MGSGKISNWLQIAGNLGLIVGLVLVGMQIHQNNELVRMQLLNESMLAHQNLHLALAGENPQEALARAATAPASLSEGDIVSLDHLLKANWARAARIEMMRDLGMPLFQVDAPATVTFREFLGNRFGRAWWELGVDDQIQARDTEELIRVFVTDNPRYEDMHLQRIQQLRQQISVMSPTPRHP